MKNWLDDLLLKVNAIYNITKGFKTSLYIDTFIDKLYKQIIQRHTNNN